MRINNIYKIHLQDIQITTVNISSKSVTCNYLGPNYYDAVYSNPPIFSELSDTNLVDYIDDTKLSCQTGGTYTFSYDSQFGTIDLYVNNTKLLSFANGSMREFSANMVVGDKITVNMDSVTFFDANPPCPNLITLSIELN